MLMMTIQKLCDKLTAFCHHGLAQQSALVKMGGKFYEIEGIWEMNHQAIISVKEEENGGNNVDNFDGTL